MDCIHGEILYLIRSTLRSFTVLESITIKSNQQISIL
uniref:Uncharacterized protein n=1 Tax=Myoviridae sp. ctBtT5 TaxID=2825048 RepID=A0A8S5Q0C8_9CAUD|nr:MAG TPA: hypothetical protein [Myoviridae sp. ctBtT5]DAQ94308.1 MAG TPA: hypothetical protein [Caudoviricetes sp.]